MRLRNIPGAQDAILESPYVVQEPQTKKGHWGEVFAKKQPLHIEVGMGKGRFLMDLARLHPDINYIGIEMYDSVLLRALQKREELEENGEVYSNLFFMRVDARLLPEIFEKGEVDKIYLNLEEVEEAGWNLEASTFDLHHNEEMVQGNVMTEYEEKFSSMGNPICKMVISREYHR